MGLMVGRGFMTEEGFKVWWNILGFGLSFWLEGVEEVWGGGCFGCFFWWWKGWEFDVI